MFVGFLALLVINLVLSQLDNAKYEQSLKAVIEDIEKWKFSLEDITIARASARGCEAILTEITAKLVEDGTKKNRHFAEMLPYLFRGGIDAQILHKGQIICKSNQEPEMLLKQAMNDGLKSLQNINSIVDGRDWATTVRVQSVADENWEILIGVKYWAQWRVFHHILSPSLYDLIRTLIIANSMGASVAAMFIWGLLRRINRAADVTTKWTKGDLRARIVDNSKDEFGALVSHMNNMADVLSKTFKIQKALAVSEERTRIARDLHDTAKQRSFVLGLKLTEIEYLAKNLPNLTEVIHDARRLSDHVHQDLENVVDGYNMPSLAELGFFDALNLNIRTLVTGTSKRTNIICSDDFINAIESNSTMAQELLMITQEAVANAVRHSDGTTITIIGEKSHFYKWTIVDNGTGFELNKVKLGMGLSNIRWRVNNLPDGHLSIESDRNGTSITITFGLSTE